MAAVFSTPGVARLRLLASPCRIQRLVPGLHAGGKTALTVKGYLRAESALGGEISRIFDEV